MKLVMIKNVKIVIISRTFIWDTKTEKIRSFKISFSRENAAVKYDLVKFKIQCLKVFCCHGNKSTILLFIRF